MIFKSTQTQLLNFINSSLDYDSVICYDVDQYNPPINRFELILLGSRISLYTLIDGIEWVDEDFLPYLKKLDNECLAWHKKTRDEAIAKLVTPILMKEEMNKIINEE